MNLEKKIKNYTQQVRELYLPYLWEEWGVEPEEFTKALVNVWGSFTNPRFKDNLLYTNYEEEIPSWYEVCDTKYKRGKTIPHDKLWLYCEHNQKYDQHISVYRHDNTWRRNVSNTGSVSCTATCVAPDYVYLELDRPTYKEALRDAKRFRILFPYQEAVQYWFSGNKSVHIAVDARLFGSPMGTQEKVCGNGGLFYNLAHRCAGDMRGRGVIDPWLENNTELMRTYYKQTGKAPRAKDLQKVKKYFESIDPNLYRVNSLIRQPYSYHETGKKQKNPIFKFDNKKIFPYLIHWTFQEYKRKDRQIEYKPIKVGTNKIIKVFSSIEGFDPADARSDGWVDGLYSPFYHDTNPSVGVNIHTGLYKDMGDPTHTFDFYEFYSRLRNVSKEQAIKYLNE